MLFYLYEVRLFIFVSKLFPERIVKGIRVFMYCLIGLFAGNTIVLTTTAVVYSANKPDGSYISNGTGLGVIKATNYGLELAVCLFILIGTFISTQQRLAQNRGANFTGSSILYVTVLTSDTTIFTLVFLFVIYKSIGSFDPNSKFGLLAAGNLGFQHLIDALQYSLMVINLMIPAVVFRSKVSGKTASRNKTADSSGSGKGSGTSNNNSNGSHAIETHLPIDDAFEVTSPSVIATDKKGTPHALGRPVNGTTTTNSMPISYWGTEVPLREIRTSPAETGSQSNPIDPSPEKPRLLNYNNQARQVLDGEGAGIAVGRSVEKGYVNPALRQYVQLTSARVQSNGTETASPYSGTDSTAWSYTKSPTTP
ncbi:hypothetical protein BJ742DRAFT_816813 [Cladochytrium replicatum]|nr:hypothetical protein BJ742DRAFT_816813 [Cladochytrium replicatum]